MVSQQNHPGVERTGDNRCQQAVAGNELQALAPIMLDGGAGRSRALPAQHLDLARLRGIENGRHFTCRTHQMRLHHLQHEPCRHAGVERIAASLQHRHAGSRTEPMR